MNHPDFQNWTQKEKKEYAEKRFVEMQLKNEEIRRRHAEVQNDKKAAENRNSSVTNYTKKVETSSARVKAEKTEGESTSAYSREWDKGKEEIDWDSHRPIAFTSYGTGDYKKKNSSNCNQSKHHSHKHYSDSSSNSAEDYYYDKGYNKSCRFKPASSKCLYKHEDHHQKASFRSKNKETDYLKSVKLESKAFGSKIVKGQQGKQTRKTYTKFDRYNHSNTTSDDDSFTDNCSDNEISSILVVTKSEVGVFENNSEDSDKMNLDHSVLIIESSSIKTKYVSSSNADSNFGQKYLNLKSKHERKSPVYTADGNISGQSSSNNRSCTDRINYEKNQKKCMKTKRSPESRCSSPEYDNTDPFPKQRKFGELHSDNYVNKKKSEKNLKKREDYEDNYWEDSNQDDIHWDLDNFKSYDKKQGKNFKGKSPTLSEDGWSTVEEGEIRSEDDSEEHVD